MVQPIENGPNQMQDIVAVADRQNDSHFAYIDAKPRVCPRPIRISERRGML
jgi:hypothetical protein